MSAPDTNTERQAKRHRPALVGMAVAVLVALALLFAYSIYVAEDGNTPQGAEEQVDGRTGVVEDQ